MKSDYYSPILRDNQNTKFDEETIKKLRTRSSLKYKEIFELKK